MRRVAKIVTSLCLAGVFFLSVNTFPLLAAKKIRIGITQILDHPALNAVRDGFIDAMAEAGYVEGKNIIYDIQNAQGDMATACLFSCN